MTTIFARDGRKVPVTVLKVGPCPIIQIKTKDRDGYKAFNLALTRLRKRRSTDHKRGINRRLGKVFTGF